MNQLTNTLTSLDVAEMVIENDQGLFIESEKFVKLYDVDVTNERFKFLCDAEYLSHVEVLELASRLSYLDPTNLDRNLKFVDLAEIMIGDKEKHFMITSLRMSVMKNFMDSQPNEFTIHELFKKNYRKLLDENINIVKRKNNPKHIPDFWLSDGHELIPVEIKLHEFKANHLKQLLRYMEFYKCDKGVAVAKKLNCPLPNNITFLNYEDLKGDYSNGPITTFSK